jgi:hypothetical protein
MAAHPRLVAGLALLLVSLAAPAASAAQGVQRTHGPDPASPAAPVARATAASTVDWCANTDPAANQLANGDYRYHAIYVHPADRPSRLAALGGQLQQDAFDASALLEREYGRAIRFDVGTPCGTGQLDISEVQLPFTEAQLAGLAEAAHTATFEAVAAALRERGIPIAPNDASVDELTALRENFLVWLDGPSPGRSCGQGTALLDATRSDTNLNNLGGKLALVFRNGSRFCSADVVRHEIGHNLGALQPDAPHTTDGVHCNDAYEDTMCELESPKLVGGPFNGLYFDYGNDDYWDPPQGAPLGWWTVNLSRFICPDAECNRPADTRGETAAVDRTTADTTQADDRERRARKHRARQRRARAARRERRAKRRCERAGVRCRSAKIVWK